jgi:hypothetical protein
MTLVAIVYNSVVDFKILVVTIQVVNAILSKKLKFWPLKKMVSLLVPPFDSRIDFKFFLGNIIRLLKPWLQKWYFLPRKKRCYL